MHGHLLAFCWPFSIWCAPGRENSILHCTCIPASHAISPHKGEHFGTHHLARLKEACISSFKVVSNAEQLEAGLFLACAICREKEVGAGSYRTAPVYD